MREYNPILHSLVAYGSFLMQVSVVDCLTRSDILFRLTAQHPGNLRAKDSLRMIDDGGGACVPDGLCAGESRIDLRASRHGVHTGLKESV